MGIVLGIVVGLVIAWFLVAGSGGNESTYRDNFVSSQLEELAGRSLVTSPTAPRQSGPPPTWSTPAGAFVVTGDGVVGGPTSSRDTPSLAVAKTSGAVRTVVAHFTRVDGDLGVIFRYADPSNYWILVPAKGYATWNLYSVESGNTRFRGNTGSLSGFGNGTITLKLSGADIEVALSPRLQTKLSSKVLVRAERAGLIAFAGASFGNDAKPGRCTYFAITVER